MIFFYPKSKNFDFIHDEENKLIGFINEAYKEPGFCFAAFTVPLGETLNGTKIYLGLSIEDLKKIISRLQEKEDWRETDFYKWSMRKVGQ